MPRSPRRPSARGEGEPSRQREGPWKRALLRSLLILLVYGLLTLIMTYPVVVRLNTHLVGFGDDMWVHYWNNWWIQQSLAEGDDPYVTDLLFYPKGVSLLYHNFGWTNILAWLALEPLAGGIVAYNLVHLLNIALCAFTMFLLARHLLKSDGPAFVAGLAYGFWPYRLSDYGHPNTVATQWFPLVMLCTILLVRARRPLSYALLLGLSMALTGLSRWQMLLPAGIAVGVYLLVGYSTGRERWSWPVAGMLALAALVTVLVIAVPFYPLARDLMLDVSLARPNIDEPVGTETDLLNYVVPPINHPLAPLFARTNFVAWRTARTQSTPVRMPTSYFLGYSVLVLVAVAILWRRSAVYPWLVLALVAFLLALGPVLRCNRQTHPGIPMPYRLVAWLPPMRLLRKPHRFNTLLALPVAVLAGHGVAALGERLKRRQALVFWVAIPALVLFDYAAMPAATVSARVPDYYHTLAEEPGDFALVELPGDRQSAEYQMYYQTVHGRPLLTGHVSRLPPGALDFAESVPLTQGIYESGSIDTTLTDLSRQLGLLADAGFRYVVLHKNPNLASPAEVAEWRRYLTLSPRYEDEQVVVYTTRPEVGKDWVLEVELGAGVGLVESSLSTDHVRPDSVVELEAIWGTTAPPGRDLALEMALVDEGGKPAQIERFDVSATWPTGAWPADTILRDEYAMPVDRRMPGGEYAVTVRLVDSKGGERLGREARIGQVTMEAPERRFAAPPMSNTVEADFGAALRLLGYDLAAEAKAASITLHWQALRRMETAYKFFVHLVDAGSGELAAQVDVMPRDWSYPTTWWEAGEVVSDRMELPLDELAAGTYHLWIGVYAPDTGRRLELVQAPSELLAEDRRLRLPETLER